MTRSRLLSLVWTLALIAGLALAGCADAPLTAPTDAASKAAPAADAAAHTYMVTIENLTGGQPLSPGVFATHTHKARLFSVGAPASEGIRLIAENGMPGTALAGAESSSEVDHALASDAPVLPHGSLSLEITARANANRFSMAVMLVCTNDGFVGLDGVRLPDGFEPVTYEAMGYDAGTEANLETAATIVDGCPFVAADGNNDRPATSGAVAPHPGIQGGADLDPAAQGWTEPAARVTIRRLK